MPTYGQRTIRYEDKMFDETSLAWVDPTFFRLLTFKSIEGDLSSALDKPNTVVLTKSAASKYFGNADPIGKVLNYNNVYSLEVTAVIEDVPPVSSLQFEFAASFLTQKNMDESIRWNNPDYLTLFQLDPKASSIQLQSKIDEWVKTNNGVTLRIEPLTEVHFNTAVANYGGSYRVTDKRYLAIFGAIGVFILFIACINYINLATARATTRSKEVGMRKTVGATAKQLALQFFSESALVLLPAIVGSIALTALLIPILEAVVGQVIVVDASPVQIFLMAAVGWIVISLLSGVYPAVVIASSKPVSSLRKSNSPFGGISIRKALVVTQFIISLSLITCTIIVTAQLRFMQNKKLGINKDNVLLIKGNRDLTASINTFRASLLDVPGVQMASCVNRSPFQILVGYGFAPGASPKDTDWTMVAAEAADENFLQTMDLKLLAGRNFTQAAIADTLNEFIVNESYLTKFGLTENEVIGSKAILGTVSDKGPGTIVGIASDFHYNSLHQKIEPLIIFNHPGWSAGSLVVRVDGQDIPNTLKGIEAKWKEFVPNRPFNFNFLDVEYDTLYKHEQQFSFIVLVFSTLAIIIACLGLLGLSSFATFQRAKELAIRKVMGASAQSLVALLSRGYLTMIVGSSLVAIPLSFYFISGWLESFQYRIILSPWYFVAAILLLMLIALSTIGMQSFKATHANPVDRLRIE
jgi:putative ABC transport system permease protein